MDLDRPAGAMGLAVDAYSAAMEPAYAAGVFGLGIARLLEANGLVIDDHRPGTPRTPIQYIAAGKRS